MFRDRPRVPCKSSKYSSALSHLVSLEVGLFGCSLLILSDEIHLPRAVLNGLALSPDHQSEFL